MKITYTAPNRAHHYPYARILQDAGILHAFVCGFPRWSPRSPLPEIGEKLLRVDAWQVAFIAALRMRAPEVISNFLNRRSHRALDKASLVPASQSDIFLYYRTTGVSTARFLKRRGVICVMEEVNSHVHQCHGLQREEANHLGLQFSTDVQLDSAREAAYEEADYILVPSEYVRRSFLDRGVPGEKLLKVPYGASLGATSPAAKCRKESFRILYVGQIHFRKGLHYLLDAFERLDVEGKELRIVGPITAEPGVDVEKLPRGAVWQGVLKGSELEQAYLDADVFVLASIDEGLALVLGEAMAHGLPIVATQNSGAEDLFSDREEGFIVPIRSSEAIHGALLELASDLGQRAKMAEKARLRAIRNNGWQESGRALVSALTEVVARRGERQSKRDESA